LKRKKRRKKNLRSFWQNFKRYIVWCRLQI